METITLKRLVMHQDAAGNMQAGKGVVRKIPWVVTDHDAWWAEVVWDRRGRLPMARDIPKLSPDACYRVDRQPFETIKAWCSCGVKQQFKKEMLLKLGPDTNVIWAIRELMGCKGKNKITNNCRAVVVR